jgi:hypothetical protein
MNLKPKSKRCHPGEGRDPVTLYEGLFVIPAKALFCHSRESGNLFTLHCVQLTLITK